MPFFPHLPEDNHVFPDILSFFDHCFPLAVSTDDVTDSDINSVITMSAVSQSSFGSLLLTTGDSVFWGFFLFFFHSCKAYLVQSLLYVILQKVHLFFPPISDTLGIERV